MQCPKCHQPTKPFDLNTLARPTDPRLYRLARQQRHCPGCGWQSAGISEVKLQEMTRDVTPARLDQLKHEEFVESGAPLKEYLERQLNEREETDE